MRLLRLAGRHASAVMLLGMVVVAFLPGVSTLLRPFLPALVSLVLGLAMARLDLAALLRDLARPRRLAGLMALVVLFLPLSCAGFVWLGHLAGAGEDTLLALAIFGAAPPISSAASLALLLGYNARITLQLGLLSIVALPVLAPLSLALVGIAAQIAPPEMAVRIASMIAGGFAIGLGLQAVLGRARIAAQAEAFNGLAALAMLLFLFPLFDGVTGFVRDAPQQALILLILALALNFGGHLAMTRLAGRLTDAETAHALGLMFGNRNISFFLAVLPANPALGFFIAAAQVPIYATPAVFGRRR